MSRTYITYQLDASHEDGLHLEAQGDAAEAGFDLVVPWPDIVFGDEEPDYSELKDLVTERILKALNDRNFLLVGDMPALMHVVYLAVAPGPAIVHPLTFEVGVPEEEEEEDLLSDLAEETAGAVAFATKTGWALSARQASDFAPAADRADDFVIVVLRGEYARKGRSLLTEVVDLVKEAATG